MTKLTCFSAFLQKKKSKSCFQKPLVADEPCETPQVKLENKKKSSAFQDSLVSFGSEKDSPLKMVEDINHNPHDSNLCKAKREDETGRDVSCEDGDEQESPLSSCGSPYIHHQMRGGIMSNSRSDVSVPDSSVHTDSARKLSVDQAIHSCHRSDPEEYIRTDFLESSFPSSSKLKRSCSNLEMRGLNNIKQKGVLSSNSQSFDDLQAISHRNAGGIEGSPLSFMTSNSADKVMLKQLSSSQLLPSRSRKICWKLVLGNQRNLHGTNSERSSPPQSVEYLESNHTEGYSSDTNDLPLKESIHIEDSSLKNRFPLGSSGGFSCNQWMAFSTPSCQSWIDEWVKSIDANIFPNVGEVEDSPQYHESEVVKESLCTHPELRPSIPSEVLHANQIIESMNPLSVVSHVSGMGLEIIPNFSRFSSLKTINLSNNFITHIASGSLPKGLHTLNLSRNKIVTIEGLRELTRLRVLDLSYNRITRIGHGLSHCTIIKELYISGNKISEVEGLRRLLKLVVLDLSFNKISTTNAIGQLVANYNTLAALNLLGNPVQTNVGEAQLRKAVCGLLTQLTYLNKQPIKPVRAREAAIDRVAKAALGDGRRGSRRRFLRPSSEGSSSFNGASTSRRTGAVYLSKHKGCDKNRVGPERLSRKR